MSQHKEQHLIIHTHQLLAFVEFGFKTVVERINMGPNGTNPFLKLANPYQQQMRQVMNHF